MMHADMRFDAGKAAKFAVGGLLVLFLCWQRVEATRLGYRVAQARKAVQQASGRVEGLRLELESGLSPAQLASRAKAMGLVPAAPDTLRALPQGASRVRGGWLARLRSRISRAG